MLNIIKEHQSTNNDHTYCLNESLHSLLGYEKIIEMFSSWNTLQKDRVTILFKMFKNADIDLVAAWKEKVGYEEKIKIANTDVIDELLGGLNEENKLSDECLDKGQTFLEDIEQDEGISNLNYDYGKKIKYCEKQSNEINNNICKGDFVWISNSTKRRHIGKKKNILTEVVMDLGSEVQLACERGIMEEQIKKSILVKTDLRAVIDKKIMIKDTKELFLIENIIINGIYCNCRKKC